MTVRLSRAAIEVQIEQFVQGKLSAQALAAWAFNQVCDEEEGLVHYEPGYAEAIIAVLDDLMWADDAAFRIDRDATHLLKTRLHQEQPNAEGEVEPTISSASTDR